LTTLAPLPQMSVTPIAYDFGLLHTMGSDPPTFPGFDDGYDVQDVKPMRKEEILHEIGLSAVTKLEKLRALGQSWRGRMRKNELEEGRTSFEINKLKDGEASEDQGVASRL
jgi:hypothetical protein